MATGAVPSRNKLQAQLDAIRKRLGEIEDKAR